MNLVQRVQDILLKPKETWPTIESETDDVASIYKDYLVYLALVPAIAAFIGGSLIGYGGFGVTVRVPIVSGLVQMVIGYIVSLAAVYLIGMVANALAPTFGGTQNPANAFKLVAYGSTAGFIGGVFSLLPSLAMLGLLASLYSIYQIFTGLPVMMKCPQEKAAPYTAALVVCGIVVGVLLAAVSYVFAPHRGGMMVG